MELISLLPFLAAFLAYLVKGMCGFANTLVYSSVLGFTTANAFITPTDLLLSFPSNVLMAVRHRKQVAWRQALLIGGLVVVGAIPGIFFLKLGDAHQVKLFFGGVVIFTSGVLLFQQLHHQRLPNRLPVLAAVGLVSGLLSGLFGIGVLLAAYLSGCAEDTEQFRGTFSVICLVETGFRLVVYGAVGILTLPVLVFGLKLLPAMLLGLGCGMAVANHIPERKMKLVIIAMLMITGVSLIVTNLA